VARSSPARCLPRVARLDADDADLLILGRRVD
jgi:hypothetical protein